MNGLAAHVFDVKVAYGIIERATLEITASLTINMTTVILLSHLIHTIVTSLNYDAFRVKGSDLKILEEIL